MFSSQRETVHADYPTNTAILADQNLLRFLSRSLWLLNQDTTASPHRHSLSSHMSPTSVAKSSPERQASSRETVTARLNHGKLQWIRFIFICFKRAGLGLGNLDILQTWIFAIHRGTVSIFGGDK